jgi:hypothetical protein
MENRCGEPSLAAVLKDEWSRLVRRREQVQEELVHLQTELDGIDRRLSHVMALLDMETDEQGSNRSAVIRESSMESDAGDPVEFAYRILQAKAGEPLYYKELAEEVMRQGAKLPGGDPALTLVSRLVRDDRFVRPFRRGWYALRIHYPKGKSVGARVRKAGRAAR